MTTVVNSPRADVLSLSQGRAVAGFVTKQPIGRIFSFDRAQDAYREAASGTILGKAVILARCRVGAAVEPDAVLAQAQALVRWVERKSRGASLWTKVPVEVRLSSGQVVRGQIDLLADVDGGRVLVDHKADPRSAADGDRLAEVHDGQLEVYAQAVLKATGRPVVERWLFLPIAG